MYTDPPLPPSPPSGPPRGTNFSRRKLRAPLPPCPAATWISTSSTKDIVCSQQFTVCSRRKPQTANRRLFQRQDGDHAALGAVIAELHRAVDLREERVVLAEPDVEAGAEPAPALTHQDRPAGDDVAVEPLDAEALRIAVAPVP